MGLLGAKQNFAIIYSLSPLKLSCRREFHLESSAIATTGIRLWLGLSLIVQYHKLNFPVMHKVGNVGILFVYVMKGKYNLSKISVRIEPGTLCDPLWSYDPFWCLADWANLAGVYC